MCTVTEMSSCVCWKLAGIRNVNVTFGANSFPLDELARAIGASKMYKAVSIRFPICCKSINTEFRDNLVHGLHSDFQYTCHTCDTSWTDRTHSGQQMTRRAASSSGTYTLQLIINRLLLHSEAHYRHSQSKSRSRKQHVWVTRITPRGGGSITGETHLSSGNPTIRPFTQACKPSIHASFCPPMRTTALRIKSPRLSLV